jgi:hypothetical protein
MAKKLYVGQLPWGTKQEALEAEINSQIEVAINALKEEGHEVAEARIEDNFFKIDERGNARFAIVTISDDMVAEKVITAMNGMDFDANDGRGPRTIVVNEARPKEDRPRDDRRSGGYGPRRDFRPRRDFGNNDYNRGA